MKYRRHITRLLALLMIALMIVGMAACGNGDNSDKEAYHVTYWIPKGEDTSFYDDYEDNPVYKYIESNYTFNGKKLEIDFVVAPPGSESDDFSTLYATGEYCGIMDMSMSNMTVTEMYEDGVL